MYNSIGGQGIQFQGAWAHNFGQVVTLKGTTAYATAFFPRWTADADFTWHLQKDWDMQTVFSYRYMRDRSSMYSLGLGFSHEFEHLQGGGKLTVGALHDLFFFNAQTSVRFYPIAGGRSYVEAQAGAGTAPELSFLNYYYSSSIYNHLNSFVSVTGSLAVTHNLALQFSGTWNTVYDQRTTITYRNMFVAHVSVAISF